MLDTKTALAWMDAFTDAINENKAHLSKLDNPIGDGDHGHNMARGMNAVKESLHNATFTTPGDVFKSVAMSLISKVGGAAGPLYGTAFLNMSKAAGSKETLEASDLTGVLEAGLNGIKTRGKATTNEKTMVDLWAPAVETLKNGKTLDHDKLDALVEATKDMQATKGRAAYLGARSIGHIDPGATSSGLLMKTMINSGVLS